MSSYAPLFGHVEAWQWTPNMIWFDNLRSYGTPNYYVQKTFSVHKGTQILPVLLDGSAKNGVNDLFTSASFDGKTNEVVLKVVNTAPAQSEVRVQLAGAGKLGKQGKVFVLTAPDLKAENSLDAPARVAPVEKPLAVSASDFTYTFLPNSLTVIRVGVNGRQARR